MALQRPVFQIDGEDFGVGTRTVPTGGGTFDIVNVSGPGLVHSAGWNIDLVGIQVSFTTDIAIEMVVDGVEIFDEFLANADLIGDFSGSPFRVQVLVADDTADITIDASIAFKTSFIIRLRNDNGSDNGNFLIQGAMQWHQGL